MKMRTEFFGGIIGVCITLLGGVQANAQCSTSMSVSQQLTANCGADVTYMVSSPVGIQSVQVTVNGEFFSSDASATISLPAGTYVIEALTIDNNNCTMTVQEEVFVALFPTLNASITVQASPCGGQCTGALMASATGGSPPYFFLWSTNPATSEQVIDDLCEGTYIVWVTDMNGCTADALVTLTEAPPTVEFFTDTFACNGTLQLDMNTVGGSGDYSFAWEPASLMSDPTEEFPNVNVGNDTVTVSVTVTDNGTGCTNTESITVYPNVQQNQTVELCNGMAELTLDPGSLGYSWTATDTDGGTIDMGGVTGNSYTATELGTYQVMTYYSGCNQVVHTFEVEACTVVQCPNTAMAVTQVAAGCGADVTFVVTNDIGFQSVQWTVDGAPFSTQQAGTVFFNPGTYLFEALTVGTDNCTSLMEEEVTILPAFTASIFNDTIACNGTLGGIAPTVSGGSGDFSYLWDPSFAVNDPTAQSPLIIASFPQWITVTVTDNETGCTASDSLYFYPNILTNATVELCSGSAELTLDPGSMVYAWTAEDPDGNPIDMNGVTGNTFTATELGTYEVMTYYSGCNQVVHEFEVVECSVQCISVINTTTTTTDCNSMFCFTASASLPIETYAWSFGGIYSSEAPSACFSVATAGFYDVVLNVTYEGGCESTSTVSVQATANGMEVSLPDDDGFVACNGTYDIGPVVQGGSGDFSYLWEPAQAVDNPAGQITGIDVTAPQWVFVTVTDNVTGCIAEDSVFVSPNLPVNQSLSLCNGSALLELDPGSATYSWMGTDANGNPIDMSGISGNTFEATVAGDYVVVTGNGGCNSITHLFEVAGCANEVWPGDADNDGEVTNTDALWVGIAFDETGPVRPDASLAWEGQPAPDWNFNFSQNNVNLKHADTDGNGTVNFADTVAISLNYGQTHGKTENALAGNIPALWVAAVPDTVAPGQGVIATVHLSSATQPVDSLHGIAFTLTFNDLLVDDADFTIDFSGNVLGTVGSDVMTLQKLFLPDGEVDVAVTRNTLQNFGGYGPLATFHIVTTDNLSGIHELRIGVSGVSAITAHGHAVELATVADTVIIDSDFVGIGEAFSANLSIHPNPTSGIVRVGGLLDDVTVEVLDATGRIISRSGNNGSASLTLDLSAQPEGFYLLRLSGAEGVAVRRVVKSW